MTDGAATREPTAGWASGPLGAVQAADREIARQTAVRARAVATFAATRPASADRPADQPGAMSARRRAARPTVLADVSEWAAQELALALEISSQRAEMTLERSLTLVHRLPRTLEALESGALHEGHLLPILERVGPIVDDATRAQLEAKLLDWMAGRVTTPAQLADKARRLGLLVDARDSARRLAEALRSRGVSFRPDRQEGMAQAVALLTVPEAAALVDALGRYADALDEPGDERTRGQKMADCLLDLVLRPGENGLAAVQAHLTVVAAVSTLAGGDQPGEIAGRVVPAEMVRALARALGLLPAAAAPSDAAPPEDAAPPDDSGADVPAPVDASVGARGRSAVERALGEWWPDVERRALVERWGADGVRSEIHVARHRRPRGAPPLEYEPLRHAGRRRRRGGRTGTAELVAPGTSEPTGPETSAGPAGTAARGSRASAGRSPGVVADEAVDAAGAALLDFTRAVGRAGAAVRRAELASAVDEATWQATPAGQTSAAADAVQAMRAVGAEQRAVLAGLLDATAGGTLADRPRVAVVDALDGALLTLTDSRELRGAATCGRPPCRRRPGLCGHDLSGCPGLGPPPPTQGYRPGAALDRYLRARDRRCRFPGCRRPVPRGGELDHDRPWPDGPTSTGNLVGYCTPHHRGKRQAPGWRHELASDGALTVTTPTGLRAASAPPPF